MAKKSRIMVVEDESIAAMDIQEGLEELGCEVPALAASGAAAIRLAAESNPDLIRIAQRIPVVFLTAHQDRDTVARAETAEPFGYLNKPCDRQRLHDTIQVALAKSAAAVRPG